MKSEARRCKCLHCKMLFVPDYRNRGRQKYCSAPECQKASKRARQQRWLSKPGNAEVDASLVYADYYLLEAIARSRR